MAEELPTNDYVLTWTGFPGQPGYTVLHWVPGQEIGGQWWTFLSNIASLIPANVRISFPSSGRTFDATNGKQLDVWTATAPSAVLGQDGGSYAAPVGVAMNWKTNTIHAGRFISGRTFLVPMAGVCYYADGSIRDGDVTMLNGNADTLCNSVDDSMVIWRRPKYRLDEDGHATDEIIRDGTTGKVKAVNIPDKCAVLTSRRP